MVIAGAEDEEYQLTIDDIDSSLVFMYTPVTVEGAKGEPQYKYTDFVKAGLYEINFPSPSDHDVCNFLSFFFSYKKRTSAYLYFQSLLITRSVWVNIRYFHMIYSILGLIGLNYFLSFKFFLL